MLGHIIEVTPTISTSAYTANDQLGGIMTLAGVSKSGGQVGVLQNVVIVDKAKQSLALDILFFDELPTVASSDNAALDITDAEVADKCLGSISIVAGDYVALNASSVATKVTGILALRPKKDATIYAVAVTRGTPTYGSTSDLVFKFTFSWG